MLLGNQRNTQENKNLTAAGQAQGLRVPSRTLPCPRKREREKERKREREKERKREREKERKREREKERKREREKREREREKERKREREKERKREREKERKREREKERQRERAQGTGHKAQGTWNREPGTRKRRPALLSVLPQQIRMPLFDIVTNNTFWSGVCITVGRRNCPALTAILFRVA